jgi:hypothetical protein
MKEYSDHIKKAAQDVEVKVIESTTETINNQVITRHVADINRYRVIYWRSENICFTTCTCKGAFFNETCKHEYTLIKKVESLQPISSPQHKQQG